MVRWLLSAALISCAALHVAACNPSNVVDDLGTLGGPTSMGLGINASGNVCGGSYLTSADPHLGGLHAFRWVDGIGMVDVGVLQSVNISEAQGINAGAQLVGGSFVSIGGDSIPHAFRANATLTMTDLGTLGGDYSYAWDINDQGTITGEAANKAGDVHAFIWTASGMRDIGTLGGSTSLGRAINETGQIAGESAISQANAIRAFRFTDGAGMANLGTLSGGSYSSAYDINNAGQVVGESDSGPIIKNDFRLKGFPLFGKHAFLWTDGTGMKDLGHLGGGTSLATAISNNGVVVGRSTVTNGDVHAFRWSQTEGIVDLNSVIPSSSGWILQEAWDVNDKGQITGFGLHNGAQHAFRYNPPGVLTNSPRK